MTGVSPARTMIGVVAAGLLATATVARGDDGQTTVTLMPRWKQGEKLRVEVVKSEQRLRDGNVTRKGGSKTDAEIEVLRADKDGYLVRWTWGRAKIDDPEVLNNPLGRELLKLADGLEFVLAIDPSGTITGVENWREVKDSLHKMSDAIARTMERTMPDLDKATIDKIRNLVESKFATRELVEQYCTGEAQVYFAVLGKSYDISKSLEMKGVLPNAIGGDGIPCKLTYLLKSLDNASGHAVISRKQVVDSESARRILEKSLREMAERVGKPAPPGQLLQRVSIVDEAEFTVDVASSWPVSVVQKRTSEIDTNTRIDSLVFKRKSD